MLVERDPNSWEYGAQSGYSAEEKSTATARVSEAWMTSVSKFSAVICTTLAMCLNLVNSY
jgi:hypothetical protein